MTPLPHRYDVTLTGGPDGRGTVSARGLPVLSMAPPVEFGGPGDAWSPEQLLLASVEACFLFTLQAVARHSRLAFAQVAVATSGTVDKADGVVRFTDILIEADLTVPPGTDVDRARALMEKSKRACLVSQSLLTPVRLDARVRVAEAVAS